ncbi:MAG: DedA family protein [SAR324 cluster bacterium]
MARTSFVTRPNAVLLIAAALAFVLLAWFLAWAIRHDAVVALAQANRWIADTVVQRMGYGGVFLLMAVESSVVPLPSELVMPPAGDLAQRLPDWNLGGVIAVGTLGSLAGALVNYWLALAIGRPLLLLFIGRYGKFIHVSLNFYERAEAVFQRHGTISIFVGRLLPGVRHLISIPAGLSRKNLIAFSVLTVAGAGLWNAILAYLGYWFGQEPQQLSDAMKRYSHWVILGALLLVALYVAWTWTRSRRVSAANRKADGAD